MVRLGESDGWRMCRLGGCCCRWMERCCDVFVFVGVTTRLRRSGLEYRGEMEALNNCWQGRRWADETIEGGDDVSVQPESKDEVFVIRGTSPMSLGGKST
jgi:hypothetical protein